MGLYEEFPGIGSSNLCWKIRGLFNGVVNGKINGRKGGFSIAMVDYPRVRNFTIFYKGSNKQQRQTTHRISSFHELGMNEHLDFSIQHNDQLCWFSVLDFDTLSMKLESPFRLDFSGTPW